MKTYGRLPERLMRVQHAGRLYRVTINHNVPDKTKLTKTVQGANIGLQYKCGNINGYMVDVRDDSGENYRKLENSVKVRDTLNESVSFSFWSYLKLFR